LTATADSPGGNQISILGEARATAAYQDLRQSCTQPINVTAPGTTVSAAFDISQYACGVSPFTLDRVTFNVYGVAYYPGGSYSTVTASLSYYAKIRVTTYNISHHDTFSWPTDLQHLLNVIRDTEPDIVGLQEVHPDDLNYLRTSLGLGYQVFSYWDNGIISRFPIVSSRDVPGFPNPTGRDPLMETFIDVGGVTVRFLNTHLNAHPYELLGQQTWFIRNYLDSNTDRLILTGDFNESPPDVAPIATRLEDTWDAVGYPAGEGVTTWEDGQRIDYIFVDHIAAIESKAPVHQPEPSDHRPVWTRMSLLP